MMLQLNPPLPLWTPKGAGLAVLVRDYGVDHDDLWTVILNETGEVWTFRNSEVRGVENATLGRRRSRLARFVEPGWTSGRDTKVEAARALNAIVERAPRRKTR